MAWVEAGSFEGGERVDDREELRVVQEGRKRFGRLAERRIGRERMLHLASLLPERQRVIMLAHLQSGLTIGELALLHGVSPRQMRRRVMRISEMMADPCFQEVAENGGELPGTLGKIARGYWMEGQSLRELSKAHGEPLHRVRRFLVVARVLLAKPLMRQDRGVRRAVGNQGGTQGSRDQQR